MDKNGHQRDALAILRAGGHQDLMRQIASAPAGDALPIIERLVGELRGLLKGQSSQTESDVTAVVSFLQSAKITYLKDEVGALLIDACFYYWRINKNTQGRVLAEKLLAEATDANDLPTQRRLHNILSVHQIEAADYQSALFHLEVSLKLARLLNDPVLIAACMANSMLALKEMGHYQDAISVSKPVLEIESDDPTIKLLKFQCATNGLFCSHRLHDAKHALDFLNVGNELRESLEFDVVMRATYEYYRALYLIDTFDNETAEDLIAAAKRTFAPENNPRVAILLDISEALCEWAQSTTVGVASSRRKLGVLYSQTKKSRLYHDDVLRALMRVYANGLDNATVSAWDALC